MECVKGRANAVIIYFVEKIEQNEENIYYILLLSKIKDEKIVVIKNSIIVKKF